MLFERVRQLVTSSLPQAVDFTLETPPDAKFGDLATNAAMLLAKKLGRNPRELATELAGKLSALPEFDRVEVAGPGFLNLYLAESVLAAELATLAMTATEPTGRKVLVEYGGENIAKPMSVGHLRSNLIGKALVNLYTALGWEVVTDNHLGDWGTQFGKLIVAYRQWGSRAAVEAEPIPELNRLYVRFHEEVEAKPELEDAARAEFKKLEDGDTENRELWEWMRQLSLAEFGRMYTRLGSQFDYMHGEAYFEPELTEILADLKTKGLTEQNTDGSVIVPLPEQLSSTPLLVRKSDGATLYATRDLAAIRFYVREFAPDLVLQCVGAEQSLHFRQVYYAAKAAGYMGETQFVHVANGLVRLPEGKMSTRKGRTIRLEDLLDEAAAKMTQILDEKGCEVMGAERATLVEQLAVGAVKFADLGRDRTGDITFTWEAALSFDGYAAPYLMYTHARARSVLRKAEVAAKLPVPQSFAPAERALVLGLLRYPLVLAEAAAGFAPHVLAQYLFGLAQSFNAFYQSLPILNAESPAEREARLYLVQRSSEVLAAGLGVLGVGAPERM